MPIKNYTTSVPATRSIEEIQAALVKHRASGILYEYEKGDRPHRGLRFKLDIEGKPVYFSLPGELAALPGRTQE